MKQHINAILYVTKIMKLTLLPFALFFVLSVNSVFGQSNILERDLSTAGIDDLQRKELITSLNSLIEMQRNRQWQKIYADSPKEFFDGENKGEFIKNRLNYKPDELENNFIDFIPTDIRIYYNPSGSAVKMWWQLYGCGKWKADKKKSWQEASVIAYWKEEKWFLREVTLEVPIMNTGGSNCNVIK